MLRDFSLRDFGASLNTVESYTNESSQGKIGLCETVNKQKCTHLGMFLASEFSTQIKPLYFNKEKMLFTDKAGEYELDLDQTVVNILGYTIKRYYLERQYDKIVKRSNIVSKDLSVNNSEGDKRQAKVELDWVNFKIVDFYEQLKQTAYN